MHTAATVEGEDRSVIDKMFIMKMPNHRSTNRPFSLSLVNALIATMGTTGWAEFFS